MITDERAKKLLKASSDKKPDRDWGCLSFVVWFAVVFCLWVFFPNIMIALRVGADNLYSTFITIIVIIVALGGLGYLIYRYIAKQR